MSKKSALSAEQRLDNIRRLRKYPGGMDQQIGLYEAATLCGRTKQTLALACREGRIPAIWWEDTGRNHLGTWTVSVETVIELAGQPRHETPRATWATAETLIEQSRARARARQLIHDRIAAAKATQIAEDTDAAPASTQLVNAT
jgi:hypothetical protein